MAPNSASTKILVANLACIRIIWEPVKNAGMHLQRFGPRKGDVDRYLNCKIPTYDSDVAILMASFEKYFSK